MKQYLLTCLLVFCPFILAQSQATTGIIEGTVKDESGGPLPGATVSMVNTATNFELVRVTDSLGRYRGVLLPLGPYRVRAALGGFSTAVRDGLRLSVGRTVSVDLILKPSKVAEVIVVKAGNSLVETSRTENTTQIDDMAVQGLPNNGRNFLDFMTLSAGVTIVQGPDGDEISVNGQKGINNNISLDGADFNNPFFGEQRGGQRAAFTFNLDAVEEIVVVTEGAPAEFGRSSSGFVQVITKSGTNSMDGSAHYFLRNDSLSGKAENPDGTRADKFDFQSNQVGFTIGGPIVKDKIFYFLTFDNQGAESTKQTNPDRIEQRVLDYYASVGYPNENAPIKRTDDAWALSLKTDFQINPNNRLTLRLSATDSEQDNGTFDVDSWGSSANATELDDSWSFSGAWNSLWGNGLYNELRFQWARENRPRDYNSNNITGQDRPLPDTAFDFGNSYRFGMPFFIPVKYHDTRLQINENLSWSTASHFFKAGVEFNKTRAFQTFIGFANGRFIFNSTDGFLNYVNNPSYVDCGDADNNYTSSSQDGTCPAGTHPIGPVLLYLQQAGVNGLTSEEAGTQLQETLEVAFFFQDAWQPRDNLTINYGIRWEMQDHPEVQTPASEVFFAPYIGTSSQGQEFPSDGTIPDDKDMWQPRLAIAWDPANNGKSLLRMTAGIYYSRIPGLMLASVRSTNGSIGQNIFRNSELTFLGPVPAYLDLVEPSPGDPGFPDVFVASKNFQNPRTDAFSFAYERELVPNLAASVKFVYTKGSHQTRFVNRNDPALGSPWSSGLSEGGWNGISTLTSVESTGESLYRGYTFSLNKAMSNNYTFQFNYTYSKDYSHDDNERDPFTFRYANVNHLEDEWGYSDRDQRHRLNGWILWLAPGGVQINTRYTYRSAQPKSLKADGSDANAPTDRYDKETDTVSERNTGRKNNEFRSLDIRISKIFKFSSWELEPIIEGFNLTNSRNLLNPSVTNLVFNFDGTVQSGAGLARQLQVGLKGRW